MTRSQALEILRKAKKPQRRCSMELPPAERIAKRKEAKDMGLRSVKQLYFILAYQDSGCIRQATQAAKVSQTTVYDWMRQPRFKELIEKNRRK